jgi:photosystem II stability/assembly factor-like uncharacterized protein
MPEPPMWRGLGPANMSGRIVDVAVDPRDDRRWFIASASGGLFRTLDAGTTFEPVFDSAATISLGAVAVAPSAPETIWVGTGEANARNSVSWGDGVYVSRDGGNSFSHSGLAESFQIGRIAIHPGDPNTVLVAALGRLWGPNRERGVFKTTDGGKTWKHTLAIDADTGAVDVLFDPADPTRSIAATWTRRRGAFDVNHPILRFGPNAGIWLSSDAGSTWTRSTEGLPRTHMGRIGLTICASQPNVVYAVIATDKTGTTKEFEGPLTGQIANAQDKQGPEGRDTGGVFRSDDGGSTWQRVNSLTPRPYYYSQIRVAPNDPDRVYVLGTQLHVSTDGGKNFTEITDHKLHVDFHALWIDPARPDHLFIGNDGGLAVTHDRGRHWRFVTSLVCGQYYRIAVDRSMPYRIVGGLQDNGSWITPSRTRFADGIRIGDVLNIGWGDGFTALPHPTEPELYFFSSQFGNIQWRDLRSGATGGVARPSTSENEPLRFAWDTPYAIARHEPEVVWVGGNRLIRAADRGRTANFASPDLTATTDGTITSLSLSSKTKGLIWCGTSDGKLWLTRNAGKQWKDVGEGNKTLPTALHVADIESSHTNAALAWVAFDGHRSDDDRVHLFRTDNSGRTFDRIGDGIERGPVLALQQGLENPDLLFAGTEFGVWVSFDRGDHFESLRGNLPTIAVRDFAIEPRSHELVIGTHGRGLFVLDITGFEGVSTKSRAKPLHLVPPPAVTLWAELPHRLAYGHDSWTVPNPPPHTPIHYWVGSQGITGLRVQIQEKKGATIRTLDVPGSPGFHRVAWDLRSDDGNGNPGPRVGVGDYVVRLTTDSTTLEAPLVLVTDPNAK